MENMGYDLTSGPGLNFNKGRRTLLDPSFQKEKPLIITIELAGGWAMCQLQSRQLISIQMCIFYHIIPMHLVNKYMIFTHLLYIFAGSHSNGEIAQ